ncbi:hypothetical protein L873DRAFT_1798610 [Choiromyces venosus 120613-1]|uniref:Uncharacterized protein n=1 Tax=Choiromyces venosus 120613-1 TaxID=1336337 RepID=A0A3N4K393_9PEZI|nr:hypothetical protein L873DRAFT_1798610 [Choiromyces venosus 120613-1]
MKSFSVSIDETWCLLVSSSVNSNGDIYERVGKLTYSIGPSAQVFNHGLSLEYKFHEVEASLRNPRVDRGS